MTYSRMCVSIKDQRIYDPTESEQNIQVFCNFILEKQLNIIDETV